MPLIPGQHNYSPRPVEEKKGILKRIWEDVLPIEEHIGAGIMRNRRLDPSMGYIKAALKGIKENTTYADVLEDAGVESKAGRLAGGIAMSIGLSPSTYLSFGATAAGKLALKGGVPLLSKAKTITELGIQAPKFTSGLRKLEQLPYLGKVFGGYGEKMIYGYRQKELPGFYEALEGSLTKKGIAKEDAIELANKLKFQEQSGVFKKGKEYSTQEQREFGRMMRGETPITNDNAKMAVEQFKRLGYEATQVKGYKGKPLLKPEDYEKYKGRYSPTLHRVYENTDPNSLFQKRWQSKKYSVPLEPWMAKKTDKEFGEIFYRQEIKTSLAEQGFKTKTLNKMAGEELAKISETQLVQKGKWFKKEVLGEIEEPAYPVGKRLIQEHDAIENAKLLNYVNDNWGSAVKLDGYKQIPDTPKWGMLAGKHVPSVVFDELNKISPQTSKAFTVFDKGMTLWKIGKTILNPGYHARNLFSSFIQKDAGDYNILEQFFYLPGTFKELRLRGQEFLEARNAAVFKANYSRNELDLLLDGMEKSGNNIYGMAKHLAGVAPRMGRKAQDFVEDLQRFDMWRHLRRQGKSASEAAELTGKYLVDYSKITEFEQKYLKRIFPFYTFARKTAPVFLETAIHSPGTIAKYPKMMENLEQLSKEEKEKEKYLPDWMKNKIQVRMPIKDKSGKQLYYDVTYTLPWGDLLDFSQPIKKSWMSFNPIAKEAMEQLLNKDAYFEREITNKYLPQEMQTNDRLIHAWRTFGANLLPGGFSFEKGKKAILQQPDYAGRIRDVPTTMLDVLLGIKLTPFDVEQGKRSQFFKLKDERAAIKERIRRTVKDQSMSEKKKKKLLELLQKRANEDEND